MTQLLEGRDTVVELKKKTRKYTLKLAVVPLAPRIFRIAAQNETYPSSSMSKRQLTKNQGNVGAAVNQVTTNELASFESDKRLKINMHTFQANHNTLEIIILDVDQLSIVLLPSIVPVVDGALK